MVFIIHFVLCLSSTIVYLSYYISAVLVSSIYQCQLIVRTNHENLSIPMFSLFFAKSPSLSLSRCLSVSLFYFHADVTVEFFATRFFFSEKHKYFQYLSGSSFCENIELCEKFCRRYQTSYANGTTQEKTNKPDG